MSFPRRSEVFWGPGKKKIRPLLVVSNDQGNRYSGDVVVIPGTTQKTDMVYPVEVLVTKGFSTPTKFQAISKEIKVACPAVWHGSRIFNFLFPLHSPNRQTGRLFFPTFTPHILYLF